MLSIKEPLANNLNFLTVLVCQYFPLLSSLRYKLPFQNFVKFLDNRKCKSKPFTINNYYNSNFTLYSISFILESSLLFPKHFFIPKLFLLEHVRSVLYHLFFFSFFETFPGWCLLVQNNGNINLWNLSSIYENHWTKFVNNKNTRTT